MSLKTHKFARKPFYVDAVRVSDANMEEVAEWCKGTIEVSEDEETKGQKFISVKVHRPLTERQTQAFIGDWVLFAGTGFKVYIPKAFDKSFEKVRTLTKAQADEAGIKVPHEPRPAKKAIPREPKKKVGNVGEALKQAQDKADVDVDYRSAETGQYVSEETAEANPDTTVKETTPKSKADVEADALIAEVLKDK